MIKIKWEVEFDTSMNLIIHKLSERIKVSYSLDSGEMKVFKDGLEMNSIENVSSLNYHKRLLNYYNDAQILKQFS